MDKIILYSLILIVFGEYLFSQYLAYRNRKAASPVLPDNLAGFYNEDRYAEQQIYFRQNNRLSFISSTFSAVLIIALLATGFFGSMYSYCSSFYDNEILVTLIYFVILFFAYDILSTPFSVYDTFVIESRFGFNKTTVKIFIADKLKGWLVAIIMGGILLSAITFLYTILGDKFWFAAFFVVLSISFFTTMFYSQLIVPLFNKQTPLPEGELRSAIEKFADKVSFKLNDIYLIDGSKRTTKSNAYFSGFGRKKRIVLYDTLVNEMSTDEVVAVLAHEIGHYRNNHIIKGFVLSAILLLIQFYILSYILSNRDVAFAMGLDTPAFAVSLIAFALLYTPVDMITGFVSNVVSRRNEYQADNYAASLGLGGELISALKKMTVKSLVNLTPDKLYTKIYYSHPTLLQRMENISKQEKR